MKIQANTLKISGKMENLFQRKDIKIQKENLKTKYSNKYENPFRQA